MAGNPDEGGPLVPVLRRRRGTPTWVAIVWRLLLVLALIGIALAVHWFGRGGLRDNVDGSISFSDVLYFTMITITTVGYGDIVPVTDEARLFDTFVVTPIRLFIWLIFLGTAYSFMLRKVWDKWRMASIRKKLNQHVVVLGYGASGAEAVCELLRRGADPAEIVVIDQNASEIERAKRTGVNVMEGDATRDIVLEAANIGRANSIIVAAGRDDTSILIVLTARSHAPMVPVSVVIRSQDNEALARQAGATTVINPTSFAGILLAGSTRGQQVADYIGDLASHGGRVSLHERMATASEHGRSLRSITTGLGVRLVRDGRVIEHWEDGAEAVRHGDVIVEISRADGTGR